MSTYKKAATLRGNLVCGTNKNFVGDAQLGAMGSGVFGVLGADHSDAVAGTSDRAGGVGG